MRKTLMALAAVSLAIPASMAIPTEGANARRHYEYREWRGRDGRMYCRKSNGTTGLIVGGVGGALVGRAIDTRGDRATGTILGAAGGALLGMEIDSTRRGRGDIQNGGRLPLGSRTPFQSEMPGAYSAEAPRASSTLNVTA